MRGIMIFTIAAAAVFFLPQSSFCADFPRQIVFENIPYAPHLIYPAGEEAVLDQKQDQLEFKWLNTYNDIRYFIFKIYKGYETTARTLIEEQKPGAHADSLRINTDIFENGQVYTWTLTPVAINGDKGNKSFNAFKFVRK